MIDAVTEINQLRRRSLPLAWRRKCNGKLYGLVDVKNYHGAIYVWIYEDGTNKALHIPLKSLAARFKAEDGYKEAGK